jgi:four helix bundle protein
MQNEVAMNENTIVDKSLDFAVRIVKLCKYLTQEHKEFVLSKQLLRAGTSIGANVAEAQRGQSKADFTAKMSIALKEANETDYWLKLLYRTDYLTENQYVSISRDINELLSLLMAICKSSKIK